MKIVIIGNGVAGTNAARHIRKRSDHEVVMISDESWQPFSRTALMYIYMGHLKKEATYLYEDWFWEKNRIGRIQARVTRVDPDGKLVFLDQGEPVAYDKLIIAAGSMTRRYGWPGQDLKGVQGLYHLQDLETMEQYTSALNGRRAVVVGGGLIGIEMVEMLHSRGIPVTVLVRESGFCGNIIPMEESAVINRHIREYGIDLRLNTELQEIVGAAEGEVVAVVTNTGETIPCGFVGLTTGVTPNTGFLHGSGIAMNRGILVDEYLAASTPDVYAIGDCAELRKPEPGRRPIEAIWYTGRMMGQTVAATICGRPTPYIPGLWFNSAKFFDIEYQVYGDVPPEFPEHISTVYWEHPGGKKSIRINFDRYSGAVTGFLLLGIRYRQEVCERWILQGATVNAVLQQLHLANFDPEFYPRHEAEVRQAFRKQHPSFYQKSPNSAV